MLFEIFNIYKLQSISKFQREIVAEWVIALGADVEVSDIQKLIIISAAGTLYDVEVVDKVDPVKVKILSEPEFDKEQDKPPEETHFVPSTV